MSTTPWYTSDKLIEAVKRKISFPINQNTFTEDDILAFANEEMAIAQVPAVMQYHEEYFVYRVQVPLITNISRYPIPDRAIGMKLRDLFWSDQSGNYFEMTRISSGDKAFFQRNIGANQAIHKFYMENNDILLTPSVVGDPTGKLNFFIFLRPNQLVRDSRARPFTAFTQDVILTQNPIPGDKLFISLNTQSNSPSTTEFVAISNNAPNPLVPLDFVISSYAPSGSSTIITLTTAHGIPVDNQVNITITGASPINSSYVATSVSTTVLKIEKQISVGGIGGTVSFVNAFVVDPLTTVTAANLQQAITSALSSSNVSAIVSGSTVVITYKDITAEFNSSPAILPLPAVAVNALLVESLIGFKTQENYTNLFSAGDTVDFLQTKPGHRTYAYDIVVKQVGSRLEGSTNVPYFKVTKTDLYTYYSNGFNFQPAIANIQLGDYVCVANECIIPQIPPDLHNALAERTAARILAAMGDKEGLQISNAKLQEIETRQGSLLDDRSEGTPQKITARHSLLRYGKMGTRKRM
jgi:hypothetical protein